MKKKYVFFIIMVFAALFLFAEQQIIFIDPGHGGKDPGAKGQYVHKGKKVEVLEKDIVLNFSKKLAACLKQGAPNLSVFLSRNDDSFVSLDERDNKARNLINNKTGLYISIHNNVSMNDKLCGFKIWSNKKNSSFAKYLSKELETKIGKEMRNNGVDDMKKIEHDRKNKADIVINLGFLSNANDVKLLENDAFLNKCAEAIANSIKNFNKK